jgi:DNA-binding CsgD family transcriptional regulator
MNDSPMTSPHRSAQAAAVQGLKALPALDRRRNSQVWPFMELLPQPVLLLGPQRLLLATNSQGQALRRKGCMQVHDSHVAMLGQLGALQLAQLLAQAMESGGADMGVWFEGDMATGWLHAAPVSRLLPMMAEPPCGEAVLVTVHLDRPMLTQAARIDAISRSARLSATERYVLLLLSDGLVVEAVARQLALRVSTVRTHVRNLLGKTQAPSLMQLLRWTGSGQALPH